MFFNPALYHGAGSNISTDIRRIANLLQISSPFGRAMEALDRTAMVRAVYPALRAMKAAGRPQRELVNAVVATAEGYAFPTNLDSDQPIGSLAPPSQVDTVLAALADDLTAERTRRRAARPGRSEKAMTTLGVIGLGRIGAFHTETLSGLPGVDGLVVTDERPDVVAAVAAKHGAKPVDSVEELLASGVDGVVVSAATPAHAELTLAAVAARSADLLREADRCHRRRERAGRRGDRTRPACPCRSGYQRRFDAAFAAAKRAVDDGSLGLLHTVRSTTMDPAPPPMEYIAGSGGIFRDCAVHDFDVLRWITGQQAVEVYATGSVQGDPRFAEFGDVDTAAVVVHLRRRHPRRGVGGALQRPRLRLPAGGARLPRHRGRRLGPGRTGAKCRPRTTISRRDRRTTSSWTGSPTRSAPSSAPSSMWSTATAAPACTVADAVEVAWLAEAATESLQRGVPVTIEEVRSRNENRRRTDLLGCVRGARMGISAHAATACSPRCATSGLSATELGPEGFLPTDPDELIALLDSYGLSCVGTFVPVLLHDAEHDPLPDIAGPLDALLACGAKVLVLAAATGTDGYDSRPDTRRRSVGHAAGQSGPARRRSGGSRRPRGAASACRHDGGDPQRGRPRAERLGRSGCAWTPATC